MVEALPNIGSDTACIHIKSDEYSSAVWDILSFIVVIYCGLCRDIGGNVLFRSNDVGIRCTVFSLFYYQRISLSAKFLLRCCYYFAAPIGSVMISLYFNGHLSIRSGLQQMFYY